MHLLAVSLYEFGQFLRILLWVFIPMVIIASLITTYIHYRNKRQQHEQDGQSSFSDLYGDTKSQYDDTRSQFDDTQGRLAATGTTGAYQGMLWIKEKYEQYRETADQKYERLKEELRRSEEKYLDLLAGRSESDIRPALAEDPPSASGEEKQGPAIETDSLRDLVEEKNSQINFLQGQLEQRIRNFHLIEYQRREEGSQLAGIQEQCAGLQEQHIEMRQSLDASQQQLQDSRKLVEEQQRLLSDSRQSFNDSLTVIEQLNDQLRQETRKVEDLTEKLQSSSQLLIRIYKELGRSLDADQRMPDSGELAERQGAGQIVERRDTGRLVNELNGLADLGHLDVKEAILA